MVVLFYLNTFAIKVVPIIMTPSVIFNFFFFDLNYVISIELILNANLFLNFYLFILVSNIRIVNVFKQYKIQTRFFFLSLLSWKRPVVVLVTYVNTEHCLIIENARRLNFTNNDFVEGQKMWRKIFL